MALYPKWFGRGSDRQTNDSWPNHSGYTALHYVKFNIGVGIDRISLSFQGDYSRFAPDFNYCRLLHRRRGHMQLLDLLLDLLTCSGPCG